MTQRVQRIIWVTLFLVVVFLIATALYFVFFRPTPPPVIVSPEDQFGGGLPGQPTGQLPEPEEVLPPGVLPPTGIVIPPSIAPTLPTGPTISTRATGGIVVPDVLVDSSARFTATSSSSNGVNFYDERTGLFNRLTPNGEIELLSNRVFRQVDNVTWAPTTDKAVLEFPDGTNIVYNFQTNESFTLPAQYKDFSFSPDSSRIAAKDLKLDHEDRWLVIVDDQGRNKQLIEHLGRNESRVQVKWNPNDSIIGTSAQSIDGNRAEVIFLTKNGQQLTKAVIQGRDLRYDYNDSGTKMVYSVYNAASNYQPTLWITSSTPGAIDTGRLNTGLQTFADKCTWSGDNDIFCAVPQNLPPLSGILESNNNSNDSLYRIDARTGQATLIAEPLVPTQIDSLIVSSDTSTLFYVEEDTGAIHKINL
jgi:hypothetical protein